jgi:hypothetical protein
MPAVPRQKSVAGRPDLAASPEVAFLDLPPLRILRVDGRGDPNVAGGEFQEAMAALFPLVYTLKFSLKRERGVDVRVGPIEALWWDTADGPAPGSLGDQPWTLLIVVADAASDDDVRSAFAAVRAKRAPAALDRVRFEPFAEGRVAQVLHVGPYAAEAPTIARLHDAIAAAGLTPRGRHHEIYLGDPRRAAPERLRTILRQPVA